jgi:tetratricopeptide (TPR) repeat protein
MFRFISLKDTNKVIGTVCLLMLVSSNLQSQSEKIDSLLNIVQKKSGIDKFDPLIDIVRLYGKIDNKEALKYAQEAQRIAYENGDSLKIVMVSRMVGQLFNRLSLNSKAEEELLRALQISLRNNLQDEQSAILRNLAIAYTYQAKYDKALKINFQALIICENKKDYEEKAILLSNIGVVYYKLKDYDKGLSYFKQCLDLKKKNNDQYDLDKLLINISLCYAYTNEFQEAEKFIDSVLVICDIGSSCSPSIQMEINFTLGVIHYRQNKMGIAEDYFLKSYAIAKSINHGRFLFDNIDYLSDINIRQNRISKAIDYLNEAEELIKHGAPFNLELVKIYIRFFRLYQIEKDYEKVAFYQQKYILLKDSVFNETLTNNLMKIEADYLERENKAKIESQNEVLILKEKIIAGQQTIIILTGALVLILGVLAGLLIRVNKHRKATNRLLDQRVKERTMELETSRDELIKRNYETELLISKASNDIRSSIATLKGLCTVGLSDINDPKARDYLYKVDSISHKLSNTIHNLRQAN